MTAAKRGRWCWIEGIGKIVGPFETEDAAMEYARRKVERGDYPHSLLGRIEDPDPGEYLGSMIFYVDKALRDANWRASTHRYNEGNGKYFRLLKRDRDAAFSDLHEVVGKWARRWIKPCRMIAHLVREVREVDCEEEL